MSSSSGFMNSNSFSLILPVWLRLTHLSASELPQEERPRGYTLCFLCADCSIGYMNQISEYEGPTEEGVRLYEAHMNRIKLRIDEARGLLYKKSSDERDLLYAVLQLRIAIEET